MSASKIFDIPAFASGPLGFGSTAGAAFAIGCPAARNTWNGPTRVIGIGPTEPTGPHPFGFWGGGSEQWSHISQVSDTGLISTPQLDGSSHALHGGDFFGYINNGGISNRAGISATCGDAQVIGTSLTAPFAALLLGNRVLAKAGSFNFGSTGDLSITGVGFQPDLVLFIGGANPQHSDNGDLLMIGAMDADGNQWTLGTRSYAGSGNTGIGAPVTGPRRYRQFMTDSCIRCISSPTFFGVTNHEFLASFVSMDTDGFTINFSLGGLNSSGNQAPFAYIALKVAPGQSGAFKVGNAVQPTSTGTQAITGIGFQPDALLLASAQVTDETMHLDGSYVSLGLADATKQRSAWGGGQGNFTSAFNRNGSRYWDSIIAAADYGSVLYAEAVLDSLDADGFTLDWTTADANARLFGYVAFSTETYDASPTVETTEPDVEPCVGTLMKGTVTPNDGDGLITVDVKFQWGTTTSYGNTVDLGVMTGDDPIDVSAPPPSLVPGQTYHYRLVATYNGGTCVVNGDDASFEAPTCNAPSLNTRISLG